MDIQLSPMTLKNEVHHVYDLVQKVCGTNVLKKPIEITWGIVAALNFSTFAAHVF